MDCCLRRFFSFLLFVSLCLFSFFLFAFAPGFVFCSLFFCVLCVIVAFVLAVASASSLCSFILLWCCPSSFSNLLSSSSSCVLLRCFCHCTMLLTLRLYAQAACAFGTCVDTAKYSRPGALTTKIRKIIFDVANKSNVNEHNSTVEK